jgi:hypothetical protein
VAQRAQGALAAVLIDHVDLTDSGGSMNPLPPHGANVGLHLVHRARHVRRGARHDETPP